MAGNMNKNKVFSGAPFGTQKTRFDISAVHPDRKMPGTYTEVPYCRIATARETRLRGPGTYEIETGSFTDRAIRNKMAGRPNWRTAHESEKMSAIPHILYKDEWHRKKRLTEMLGPGRYNIQDFIEMYSKRPTSTRGICQTTGLRLQKEDKFKAELPGPGTYGDGGDPWRKMEESAKKSFCTVGEMGVASERPSTSKAERSGLAPGSYKHIDSISKLLNKRVSSRGPYDLCTGARIPVSKRNLNNTHMAPGLYEIPPFTDALQDIHHKRQGLFSGLAQYPVPPTERIYCSTLSQWPRNENDPGPGHYTHRSAIPSSAPPNRHSFNSLAARFRKTSKKTLSRVGPGQYDVNRWHNAQHRNHHESVFKSHTIRLPGAYTDHEQLLNEKIHPKHISQVENLVPAVEQHLTGVRT